MFKFVTVLLMVVVCGAMRIEEAEKVSENVPEIVEENGEAGLEIYENTALGLAYSQFLDSKIAAGTPANKTLALDYVLLSVVFRSQAQICGGTLVTDQWVLTSGTCLRDPYEGEASYVYAAVGGSGKPTLTHEKIFVMTEYVDIVPPTYKSNIAMVKLSKPVKLVDKKVALAVLDSTVYTADLYNEKTMVMCGWGSTANKPTPPKKLTCTTLVGTKSDDCKPTGGDANPDAICTNGGGRENNVCPGDFGGPLYLNNMVVGIASWGPNMQPGASCLGAHKSEHTPVGLEAVKLFIDETKTK